VQHYDVAVIGAGIAGASIAYTLANRGLKVAVLDSAGIAQKASGAAGAFISPKLGKPNPNKAFIHNAYRYVSAFYHEHFPHTFIQRGLLRMPQKNENKEHFFDYESFIDVPYERTNEGFFFPEGGMIAPSELIPKMLERSTFYLHHVDTLAYEKSVWQMEVCSADHVVLATGFTPPLINVPYFYLRGVWGERIRIESSTPIPHNYHRDVSISTRLANHQVIIGATNDKKKYDETINKAAVEILLQSAREMMPLSCEKVLEVKGGFRPASTDYMPVIGPLIKMEYTPLYEQITKGVAVPHDALSYYPNLYVHTGHGARGFVTAPLTAKMLADYMMDAVPLANDLDARRFFYRWMRRQGSLKKVKESSLTNG